MKPDGLKKQVKTNSLPTKRPDTLRCKKKACVFKKSSVSKGFCSAYGKSKVGLSEK